MKSGKFLFAFAILCVTAACSRDLSSSTYTSSSTSGVVLEGVIISARPVTVKENDKLQNNTAGIIGGGVAGGVAGSAIGGGKGSALAAVGGAIIGAVAGAVVEDQLGTTDGMEYIVRVNHNNIGEDEPKTQNDVNINTSKKPSTSTINTKLKTEMISVVQGKDQIFTAGQHVYVVYNDDRPRVVAKPQ